MLQRVTEAAVRVDGEVAGAIGPGLLVLLGVERGDGDAASRKLADKVVGYRVFADGEGRMNLSVADAAGAVLVVSQFTLAADTRKGLRPSFSPAADPPEAERLYEAFAARLAETGIEVATGRFGAAMQVSLCNDGPVTFLLEV